MRRSGQIGEERVSRNRGARRELFLEEPAYTFADVSRFLGLSPSTIRSWFVGQKGYRPVFSPAASKGPLRLSFLNLVEANTLGAIRRRFKIPLQRIRVAIEFLEKHFKTAHPLAQHRFETDGVDLFVRKAGLTISASKQGQAVFREVLEPFLRRVEWKSGHPVRFFPSTRDFELDASSIEEPRVIVIDPTLGGG